MFKCFPIFGIRHIPAVAQKQQVVSTYIKQDWLRYASPGAWGFSPPLAAGTLCEWRGCDLPCVDNNRSSVCHLVMSVRLMIIFVMAIQLSSYLHGCI